MNDVASFFVQLAAVGLLIWWLIRKRSRTGRLYVGNKTYDYRLGDDLPAEVTWSIGQVMKFKGIDIKLDKTMPHIYLDSHHDSKMSGPRFYISKEQRVSLEGNFDTYFYLYAADGYKQLALSIITPDVMQTLISSAHKFDVEIKGSHLRLISQRNVFKKSKREAALLEAAQTILEEVAHRLKSWRVDEIKNSQDAQLRVKPEQSIKFGRSSFRLAYLICIIIGLMFSATWLIMTSTAASPNGIAIVADSTKYIGLVVCFIFPFTVLFGLEFLSVKNPRLYRAIIRLFIR